MNINAITKKQMKGALITTLLVVSAFLFIPTLFLQQSYASTTIYTVNNEIWINATGISPSGDGEPTFLELKLDVSQSADRSGGMHISANEGDRDFTPTERQEWLVFKDMTRVTTTDPTDYYTFAPNAARYFGFQYVNNSINASSIPGSYLESRLPATSFGAAVREVTLEFSAPATYAAAYCAANGYTYQNVINASYEQVINHDALNTYRSRFIESVMYTLEDTTLSGSSVGENQTHLQGFTAGVVGVALLIFSIAFLWYAIFPPPTPPTSPTPLDPPPATEIENMTIWAIETYGNSADAALEAYLNGSIDFATYTTIVDRLGDAIFGGLNNSVTVLEDLWRDYYNASERMYDTYSDMYDNYLQAFSASWTDYLTLFLILVVVIIVLVIIYKVVSKKKEGSTGINAPVIITPGAVAA